MAESDEKNRLGIVLAVVAGLLALGLTFVFLQRVKTEATSSRSVAAKPLATKKILMTTKDLPAGHRLDINSDLMSVDIPLPDEMAVFAGNCVDAAHPEELQGRSIGMALPARYPLFYSSLFETFSIDDDFTSGYLKTITLSRENFFSNHLVPGDRVDVLVTIPKKKEEKAPAKGASAAPRSPEELIAAALQPMMVPGVVDTETITILENVEVFMVGSRARSSRVRTEFSRASQGDNSNEVTFRLSKEAALVLTQYANNGTKISLLLRPNRQAQKDDQ
ncbi:hypothetical protein FACS1894139_08130 [Planctomycetales bacterium]|nr:hypothetical protein FACS1894107_00130 [Planctomycetales bacterium]GHS96285.1 hypothetical protein FACS1894108_00650 [Planctomycetales bacterium]GHT05013.1 hypothetical protein FACS1894139_08130 [Planctomycetales bacterium]GHV19395.1 hypothetical protein AGMMS49959_04220 [Planctomycetales bacterium]